MLNTGGPCKKNTIKYTVYVLKNVYYLYFNHPKDETPLVFSTLGIEIKVRTLRKMRKSGSLLAICDTTCTTAAGNVIEGEASVMMPLTSLD